MFSVLVIRLRSLRLLRVSGIVMRLRMFLLLITFLKASHSFRNRLLVICKNAYLFATMIMTSVSSPFFFFQAEDGIRDADVTGVQTCALPIWTGPRWRRPGRPTPSERPSSNARCAWPATPLHAPFSRSWSCGLVRSENRHADRRAGEIGRASCRERV